MREEWRSEGIRSRWTGGTKDSEEVAPEILIKMAIFIRIWSRDSKIE